MGALGKILGAPAPSALDQALSAPTAAPAPAPETPKAGYLPGSLYLDPKLAPVVPAGAPRPFAPGEYVRNPDKSWSSEISMTVAHPDLNKGAATNIPSLWVVNGKPYRAANEDEAVALAIKSGLAWPSFPDIDTADKAAAAREALWQGVAPEKASAVPPLWTPPTGKPK